jgi:hypothetical protein
LEFRTGIVRQQSAFREDFAERDTDPVSMGVANVHLARRGVRVVGDVARREARK